MKEYLEPFQQPNAPLQSLKSTIISIVPFEIREEKPGLIPGTFHIPASTDGRPRCLVIGESIHYVYIDHDRGNLRVKNTSYDVAKSIVNDYLSSQLAARIGCHPGLFWMPGELTPEDVETKHATKLAEMRQIQNNWFVEIVKIADDDWEKTRQHYCISDFQRYAVKAIDPENKRGRPWVVAVATEDGSLKIEQVLCPACGSDIPKNVVICRYCQHVIDPERYKQMSFASSIASTVLRK